MHVQFSTHINPALPIVLRLNSINRTKVSRNGRQNAGLLIRIRWRQCSRRSPRNNLKQTTGTIRIFGSISTDPLVGTSLYKSIWIINGAFFIVGPHVAALGKSQTTIWTGIRLRSGMIVEMSLEMMLLREGLRAQGALVGLQTRMQTSAKSYWICRQRPCDRPDTDKAVLQNASSDVASATSFAKMLCRTVRTGAA